MSFIFLLFSTLEAIPVMDNRLDGMLSMKATINIFGIPNQIRHSKAKVFRTIGNDTDTRAKTVKIAPKFPLHTGFNKMGKIEKVYLYEGHLEQKIGIQIIKIRQVKRIGGGYPYGPFNGSISIFDEPLISIHKRIQLKGKYNLEPFSSKNASIKSSQFSQESIECRYCFSYWKRQRTFVPPDIYSYCCLL